MDSDLSFVMDEEAFVASPPDVADEPFSIAAERMIEAMHDVSIGHALRLLLEARSATGASLGEWDGRGEPRVLSAVGSLAPVSEQLDICRFFIDASRHRGGRSFCTTTVVTNRLQYACAVLAHPGRDLLTLVVWSHAPQPNDLSLLRLFLRLADPLRPARPRRVHVLPEDHEDFPAGYVAGYSTAMQDLHRQMRLVAQADFPLLVTGETGAGKEHVVRALHAWSPRRRGPFVKVHCAALGDKETFPLADGGTLFLDEVGDLSPALQTQLLRMLHSRDCRARIIAATNTDVQGRLRSDLYYRLAGTVLRVPSLRERPEDIPQLVEHFVRAFSSELPHAIRGVSARALELLTQSQWPGNVRQLEHEMRRLVYACAPGRAIDSTLMNESIVLSAPPLPSATATLDLATRVDDVERHTIRQALLRSRGNRSVAARLLGLSRNGLALKIRRLAL
jgi:sigma-54-interacting transcriptional regulator/regulatory Fis family protein